MERAHLHRAEELTYFPRLLITLFMLTCSHAKLSEAFLNIIACICDTGYYIQKSTYVWYRHTFDCGFLNLPAYSGMQGDASKGARYVAHSVYRSSKDDSRTLPIVTVSNKTERTISYIYMKLFLKPSIQYLRQADILVKNTF